MFSMLTYLCVILLASLGQLHLAVRTVCAESANHTSPEAANTTVKDFEDGMGAPPFREASKVQLGPDRESHNRGFVVYDFRLQPRVAKTRSLLEQGMNFKFLPPTSLVIWEWTLLISGSILMCACGVYCVSWSVLPATDISSEPSPDQLPVACEPEVTNTSSSGPPVSRGVTAPGRFLTHTFTPMLDTSNSSDNDGNDTDDEEEDSDAKQSRRRSAEKKPPPLRPALSEPGTHKMRAAVQPAALKREDLDAV